MIWLLGNKKAQALLLSIDRCPAEWTTTIFIASAKVHRKLRLFKFFGRNLNNQHHFSKIQPEFWRKAAIYLLLYGKHKTYNKPPMGDIVSDASTTISMSHSCSLAALVTSMVPKMYITIIKTRNDSIFSFFCHWFALTLIPLRYKVLPSLRYHSLLTMNVSIHQQICHTLLLY